MVCKKSEYRRQFRKPSWETHITHYQEKVDYRTYRRFLEHRHTFVPWDWDSSSSNSSSSNSSNGERPQSAPNLNNNGGASSKGHRDVQREQMPEPRSSEVRDDRRREAQQRLAPPADDVERRLAQDRGRRTMEKVQPTNRSQSGPQPKGPTSRPRTSPPKTRKAPPGKSKPDHPPWKPPIAAYGWADSSRDIGAKLTYNVKSSAHPAYVHPDALRAMKRREMIARERQKEEDRIARHGKPTARAVFTVVPPRDNVWLTEYQSSYCSPTKPT